MRVGAAGADFLCGQPGWTRRQGDMQSDDRMATPLEWRVSWLEGNLEYQWIVNADLWCVLLVPPSNRKRRGWLHLPAARGSSLAAFARTAPSA